MRQVQMVIHLTSDGHTSNGQTQQITVTPEHSHLVSGKAIMRMSPNEGMFIVRDSQGKYLRRVGAKSLGVSLSSYLHGKTHMRRVDDAQHTNFLPSCYIEGSGKYKMIEVLATHNAKRPSKLLYKAETLKHNPASVSVKKTPAKQIKLAKPAKPAKVVTVTKKSHTVVDSPQPSSRNTLRSIELVNNGDEILADPMVKVSLQVPLSVAQQLLARYSK